LPKLLHIQLIAAGEVGEHRWDRRSVLIKLTKKGHEARDIVAAVYQKHIHSLEQVAGIYCDEFISLTKALHRLERFWTDQILYRL